MSNRRRGLATNIAQIIVTDRTDAPSGGKGGGVTFIAWLAAYVVFTIAATLLMGHFLAFSHDREDDGTF